MNQHQAGAIAVFVKTPGHSAVKTRLGRTIGTQQAEEFYQLSVCAVEAVVRRSAADTQTVAYWAVAEEAALAEETWAGFNRVSQGQGELGDRLARVYNELLARHRFVVFLGADAPQLRHRQLTHAIQLLQQRCEQNAPHFVLGRTDDGGFYFFGGNCSLPADVWLSVPYSVANTAEKLATAVTPFGALEELEQLYDVDTETELRRLGNDASLSTTDGADFLNEQQAVLDWSRARFANSLHREDP